MLLQRCIKTYRSMLVQSVALAMLLFVVGCATAPSTSGDDGNQQTRIGPDGKPLPQREIPPEAQTLYEQAVAAMSSGDMIDAELRFKEFLLNYPDFPGAHVNLAIIFAERGDDGATEGKLTDALILDPEHPAALNQLGMLLRRQGKFVEAERAYLKAVTADPDYALAHYNLGVLNDLYFQRLDDALQHYQRYQELEGEDEQVSKWIADLTRRISASQRTANVTE